MRRIDSGCRGFTLLEVLVALAILGLGMIAVFSGMSQSLRVTERLRNKTLANWVALNRIAEMRISGEYPKAGNRQDEVEMAHQEWAYEMKISEIPGIEMRRLDIQVSIADSPDDILATVIGFIGPRQNRAPGGNADVPGDQSGDNTAKEGFGSGWEPPQENLGETG
jgi:general secretion pathway protein I